ncbi:MAG: SDR family NAD(P)-dependent oxidoreductase [Sphingomonadaceae bacterium]
MRPDEYCERYGPVALVTGASSGIGQGFAEELAARGFDLIVTARRTDRLEALAARLAEEHGTKTQIVTADLADPAGPGDVISACAGQDIGLVVSNAGFNMKGAFEAGSASRMEKMLAVNCNAPMQLAHGLIPALKARAGAGRGAGLIVVSSVEGLIGCPYSTAYAATKALVKSLCEGLWAELRPRGVEVLACCPGATDTEAMDSPNIPDSVRERLQPARECAALTLDNIAEGPTYIPNQYYREMFEHLTAQPRRETLLGMEQTMRAMA